MPIFFISLYIFTLFTYTSKRICYVTFTLIYGNQRKTINDACMHAYNNNIVDIT